MEPRPLNTKIVYVAHLPEYCPGLLFKLTQVAGGTAITLPQFEPKSFLAALERWRPTVLQLPPPLISFLADHPSVADFPDVVCSFSFVMEHK